MVEVLAFVYHAQDDGQIPESDAGAFVKGKGGNNIGSSL